MNLKNINIGTQLKISFSIILLFIIILGATSYFQNDRIFRQGEALYLHPYSVRQAISEIKTAVVLIQRDEKNLFLYADETDISRYLNRIETTRAIIFEQIDTLFSQYLGPKADIDSLKKEFIIWNSIRDETIRRMRAGDIKEAAIRTRNMGIEGIQVMKMLKALLTIDDFSSNKSKSFYQISKSLKDAMINRLLLLVGAILLASVMIVVVLIRNIRNPVKELTAVTRRFHAGDIHVRSSNKSKNELGVLSDSFNTLAESIRDSIILNESISDITRVMLSEDDAGNFFQSTLITLSTHINAQMAAVYLLTDDTKTFEHFESVGIAENARKSFDAGNFEGEFGMALLSRKVQHIINITEDTRFIFHTVNGKYFPREIIVIPILANNKVTAIISLATINAFGRPSVQLVNNILGTLNARIEGILTLRKIKLFSEKLELQNTELESQKTELSTQSTALMEQNTELEMQKKQLDEASRMKTVFLSNMSHELRTPLNSVIALSGVLSRRLSKKIPDEEYAYLDVIERNGKQLLSLINDILDISRIEAGHEDIEITRFSVNNLLSDMVTLIRPQTNQKNIELTWNEMGQDVILASDINKCRHILQNLISNAVKFTEKGGVTISAGQDKNEIAIAVTDTGIGISEENLQHIFDEFRQADGSTARRFGGTGLGLAIAKKYTTMLGGAITVKSHPGRGSSFTLSLPLSSFSNILPDEARNTTGLPPTTKKSLSRSGINFSEKTILLVEDSEPAIIQIKEMLEENGYHILVARNGSEALQIIDYTIPDAMMLDLMMPETDGFQVLKSIRETERTEQIPVLILTAKHITKEELRFLKQNNVHQLIRKGDVNREELLHALESILLSDSRKIPERKHAVQPMDEKPVIMVIEDNPDNRLTVIALLSDNYTVIEATNGREGLEKALIHKPNLILMDIALPLMDGVTALKNIRKITGLQHIPVIALTANAMANDRETLLTYGFDGYIPKPIDEILFYKTIRDVLGHF